MPSTLTVRLVGGPTAVLFCGVSLPHRFDGAYLTRSADAAAQAAEVLGVRAVVPVHFEGWPHFAQSAHELGAAFAAAGIADLLAVPDRGRASASERRAGSFVQLCPL